MSDRAFDRPTNAGLIGQEQEYYIRRILQTQPEREADPYLIYGDAKLEYLRLVNDGTIVDMMSPDSISGIVDEGIRVNPQFSGIPVNAALFGIVADGNAATGTGTDNTQKFIDAILYAESRARTLFIPPGSYRITDTIPLPSKTTIFGETPATTTIFQTTPGKAVMASKNWFTKWAANPTGRAALRSIQLRGESIDPASHGLILRDYYSTVENVVISQTGGDSLVTSHYNEAGATIPGYAADGTVIPGGGTIVENHYNKIFINQCKGYGFIAKGPAGKITDAFVNDLVIRGLQSPCGLLLQGSGGWQFRGIHTYGSFTGPAIDLGRMWATVMDGVQIEEGWTGAGIRISNYQRAGILDNIHVTMGPTGGVAVDVYGDRSLYAGTDLIIGSLAVVSSHAGVSGTGISLDTLGRSIIVGAYSVSGPDVEKIAKIGGYGAANIKTITNAQVTSELKDSVQKRTLLVNGLPLITGNNANWQGNTEQTISLAVSSMGDYHRWAGIISINGAKNSNGGKACYWVANISVFSKAPTDEWTVYITDILPAVGFTVPPVVTVQKGSPGTVNVTFTAAAADTFGTLALLNSYK